MIKYYFAKQGDKKVKEIGGAEKDCWIHMENPSAEEIMHISTLTGVEEEYLNLDPDEVAHLHMEDNYRVIVIDIPKTMTKDVVQTIPLFIIQTEEYIITLTGKPTSIFKNFFDGKIKNVDTSQRTKTIYQMILKVCQVYLFFLRQIDRKSDAIQKTLSKSMQNKELLQLHDIQKSLVFFSASLTSNFSVIQKLSYNAKKTSEEEQDILEDIILDNKQGIEMCSIYREIIKASMDTFASVVNNNQNTIMKLLTAITIILAIPTLIASFWGMNTGVPWEGVLWGFWIVTGISIITTITVAIIMWRKKMF